MELVVLSPSPFTSFRGAHDDQIVDSEEEAFSHEENYVSEAMVPFSWEERPGVPLYLSSDFGGLEFMRESEKGVIMVHSKASSEWCENEEETLASPKHILLFPLPPPPCSLQISSREVSMCTSSNSNCSISCTSSSNSSNCEICTTNSNSNCKPNCSTQCACDNVSSNHHHNTQKSSTSYLNSSNGYVVTSTHNTKPSLNAHTKKTHISKAKGSSFPPFLTKNIASSYVGTAIAHKDDPFLRAMQACSTDNYTSYGDYKTTPNIITTYHCDSLIRNSFDYVAMASKDTIASKNFNDADMVSNDASSKAATKRKAIKDANMPSKNAGSKAAGKSKTIKEVAEDMSMRSIESNGATRVQLRSLILAKEGNINCSSEYIMSAKSYEGHPAIMVASIQQSTPKMMMMKKEKPAIAKPMQNRNPSYGCFKCRSADVNYNSIVRISNP